MRRATIETKKNENITQEANLRLKQSDEKNKRNYEITFDMPSNEICKPDLVSQFTSMIKVSSIYHKCLKNDEATSKLPNIFQMMKYCLLFTILALLLITNY